MMKAAVLCAVSATLARGTQLVSSEALQGLVSLEGLVAGTQKLQDFAYSYPDRNRVFGGLAHNDTVNWLAETLEETGYYDVNLQPFVELYSGGNASLSLNGKEEPVGLFTYTPSGSVQALLVAVSNLGCAALDFPAAVSGNIALVSRGNCTFAIKAGNARRAGAKAAIIYDNVDSANPATGTLGGTGDYVPIAGITKALGNELVGILQRESVLANLIVNSVLENRTTFNVIAETKGGDHNNVISLGGHSDSVEAGPGINDDGSGIIGILEVAKALTKFDVKNAVRFCFWSAEEFGLLGSTYYVSQLNETSAELAKIRAYLNFDMIASPNYVLGIYDGDGSAFNLSGPAGSAQIEANFENFFKAKGNNSVPTEFSGRSDYGPFLDVGIAAGGLFTGAEVVKTVQEANLFGGEPGISYDVNYHKAGDTTENLNLDAFLLNTQAIADSVATYALSLDSIPAHGANPVKRDMASRKARKEKREMMSRGVVSHGHSHCHATERPAR